MIRFATGTLLTTFLALGFSLPASAGDIEPLTPSVALGSDYFQTAAGTFFNFGGSIGSVNFMGLPIGPGNTDTIVQRQADASIGGPAIPIQIVALSLESTAPVNIGGSFFDVFVTLDPANLTNDTGTMSIGGTTAGGTFSSNLNVFFDAHFQPVSTGSAFDVLSSISLSNAGSLWSSTPSGLIVNGVDDGSVGDQNANQHSGLLGCPPLRGNGCEVDFFVTGQLSETNTGEAHVVTDATPEPRMLFLLIPALIALSLKRRLRPD